MVVGIEKHNRTDKQTDRQISFKSRVVSTHLYETHGHTQRFFFKLSIFLELNPKKTVHYYGPQRSNWDCNSRLRPLLPVVACIAEPLLLRPSFFLLFFFFLLLSTCRCLIYYINFTLVWKCIYSQLLSYLHTICILDQSVFFMSYLIKRAVSRAPTTDYRPRAHRILPREWYINIQINIIIRIRCACMDLIYLPADGIYKRNCLLK